MSEKSNRESAVSPVIGTILLVAITVALVAIIGAVMMSLADSEDGKKVGMNAQPVNTGGPDAKLILYGGESLSELVKLEMIDQDSPYGSYVEFWNITEPLQVGLPYLAEKVARPTKGMTVYDTKINVKGTFTDGREVVLLLQPMTFENVVPYRNVRPVTDYIKEMTNGEDLNSNALFANPDGRFSARVLSLGDENFVPVHGYQYNYDWKIITQTATPYPIGSITLEFTSESHPTYNNKLTYGPNGGTLTATTLSGPRDYKNPIDYGIWKMTLTIYDEYNTVLSSSSWYLEGYR